MDYRAGYRYYPLQKVCRSRLSVCHRMQKSSRSRLSAYHRMRTAGLTAIFRLRILDHLCCFFDYFRVALDQGSQRRPYAAQFQTFVLL